MALTRILKKVVSILPSGIERDIYWNKNRLSRAKKIKEWEASGKPIPPPHQYKQLVVEEVSKRNNLECLVETGTFLGHMVEAQKKNFKQILSVELDQQLFDDAVKKFKPYHHIALFQGDSANKISEMLEAISVGSVLFWLDGHYSGGITAMGEKQCPVFEELEVIFKRKIGRKYILIDDARLFIGTNDYPTIPELDQFIRSKDQGLKLEVLNDIIHISYP